MFDYAVYNSRIYTKRFYNYNSGAMERQQRGRENPTASAWRWQTNRAEDSHLTGGGGEEHTALIGSEGANMVT